MSDQKDAIIRWFEEVWNQNRRETIEELMPPDCVIHDAAGDIHGPEGFKLFAAALRSQFTDIRVTPHQAISDGDLTSLRWSATMRHVPTGKPLSTTGMSLVRFKDGRFAEAWQNWDLHGVNEQIAKSSAAAAGSS
jgi:ketosteroid isomerase-like protein